MKLNADDKEGLPARAALPLSTAVQRDRFEASLEADA